MKILTIIILFLTFQTGYSQNADSLSISPNPFDTSTYIYYGLANNDTISLDIYNNVGDTVMTFMHDSLINAGYYSIYFPADTLAYGIYIVSMKLGTHKIINKEVVRNNMSSVTENVSLNGLLLYPNPTSNLLTISINGIKNIIVTDLSGKTYKSIKTRENKISLADLNAGTYIISVFSFDNKLLATEKVIKTE